MEEKKAKVAIKVKLVLIAKLQEQPRKLDKIKNIGLIPPETGFIVVWSKQTRLIGGRGRMGRRSGWDDGVT